MTSIALDPLARDRFPDIPSTSSRPLGERPGGRGDTFALAQNILRSTLESVVAMGARTRYDGRTRSGTKLPGETRYDSMDTPITTRIAHLNGAHHGEEETAASAGCGACYRIVAEGGSAPRGRFDSQPPTPRPSARRGKWLDRLGKDFTAYVLPGSDN